MNYHAHIYWENSDQRNTAVSLRPELSQLGCQLGRVWDEPIGPHPLPMYQVNYSSDLADQILVLLNNTNLSILLHEDTGDDIKDHTAGARWIGTPLTLDIEWLRANQDAKQN